MDNRQQIFNGKAFIEACVYIEYHLYTSKSAETPDILEEDSDQSPDYVSGRNL